MASETIGIRITAEGVFEVSSGMRLTAEQVKKVGDAMVGVTQASEEFTAASKKAAQAARDMGRQGEQAADGLQKTEEAADRAEKRMSLLAKAGFAAGAAIGAFAYSQVTKLFSEINRADALQDLSERTKIAVADLSVLAFQATQTGTDINKLAGGLRAFNKVLFDAQKGGGENANLLRQLEIDPAAITNQTQAIDVLRDRISRITDESTQMAVAQRLLGRAMGQDLLPFLTQSTAEFAKSREEGERWAKISNTSAKEAANLKDQLVTLDFAGKEFARTIQAFIVPRLNEMLEKFLEGRKRGENMFAAIGRAAAIALRGTDLEVAESELDKLVVKRNELRKLLDDAVAFDQRIGAKQDTGRVVAFRNQLADAERLVQGAFSTFVTLRDKRDGKSIVRGGEDARTPITIDPASLRDEKGGGKGNNVGDRISDAIAELKDRLARASDDLEEAPELKRYFDLLRRITTGDLRDAPEAQKRSFAQVATDEFTVARRRRELNEESTHALKLMRLREQGGGTEDDPDARGVLRFLEDIEKQRERVRLEIEREATRQSEVLAREAAQIWEATRTPLEKYNDQLERLQDLMDSGFISWDTYGRAVKRAAEEMERAEKKSDELGKSLEDAIRSSTSKTADLLLDWAFGVKATVSDVVRSILRDIARVALNRNLIEPLSSSGASLIARLFKGDGEGELALGSGSIGDHGYNDFAVTEHSGGIIGRDSTSLRHLPRYHTGGISQDEQLAVLRRGEGVFTPAQMQALAPVGAGNQINVSVSVDATGGSVRGAPEGQALGGRILDAVRGIVVDELYQQRRPGGALAGA